MQPYVVMLQADPDDRDITESMLAEIQHPVPIRFIGDMHEWESLVVNSGKPSIVLMNVRGTAQNGKELLQQIRSDSSCSHIPVVVLGEVSSDHYIRRWYHAGANSFIVKPSSLAETRKKIQIFFDYWFGVAAL
jgi:DNA-binding NarL/FixJ family response regulator